MHAELYAEQFGRHTRLDRLRKHFKAYISGIPHIPELRARLMHVCTLDELQELVAEQSDRPLMDYRPVDP